LEAEDTDGLTESMCLKETAFWQARRLDYQTVREELEHRHRTRKTEFLFRIRDGHVFVEDKAQEDPNSVPVWRPLMYLRFLNEVVSRFCADLETDLIINVSDGDAFIEPVPVFSFQKKARSNTMLLPDVDFLEFDFYESQVQLQDDIAYHDKTTSAVFAGSASGGPLTLDDVVRRTLPRLRSAMSFKGNPRVDFRLPVLPDRMSDDARAAMQELGFGSGNDRLTFKQQFRHKFIISMDGFGATCSRLPIALASNSVLLKYESQFELFYFSGLIPWFHYIPIGKDDDVNVVIRMEERQPGTCAAIVRNANSFARTYLSRIQIMKYTARLLQAYAASIDSPTVPKSAPKGTEQTAPPLAVMVHIEGVGDSWFDAGEWAGSTLLHQRIEGVLLRQKSQQDLSFLRYATFGADGARSASTSIEAYCGSRGKRAPIIGFVADMPGHLPGGWQLRYSGRFVDGSVIGPLNAGDICRSPSGAALNALKIQLETKSGRVG
jgi:hypothetical protein